MTHDIFKTLKNRCKKRVPEEMTMKEFLERVKTDPGTYASPAQRLLTAIGEPELIDTSKDERLRRIFNNRIIKCYKPFRHIYGIEDAVETLVGTIKHAAQGLEESRAIIYMMGPPGSAKSTMVEILKDLMEQEPIYMLKDSPVHEHPFGLFSMSDAELLGVPEHRLKFPASGWAEKRLEEYGGDISKFKVVKTYPDRRRQFGIGTTPPGDKKTTDISILVGKLDIRKLEEFSQDDPDSYSYSGGLCHANQGLLDYIEMFKADNDILNPLLTAVQEGTYNGTEAISVLPFDGLVVAHSNESEWNQFRKNMTNEAFLDRITLVKVPYCLRVSEEEKIHAKFIRNSQIKDVPIAPHTFKVMSQLAVLSRLTEPTESKTFTKMRVYDGDEMENEDVNSQALAIFKNEAGPSEGFFGISTRAMQKLLSRSINSNIEELEANPVSFFKVFQDYINKDEIDPDLKQKMQVYLEKEVMEDYRNELCSDIQEAVMDYRDDWAQNELDLYIMRAEAWLNGNDLRDDTTGQFLDRRTLDNKLSALEKPAGITNPKDFREEVVRFCLKYASTHDGKYPPWDSYYKFKSVIQQNIYGKLEELLPVISFDGPSTNRNVEKRNRYIERMKEKGYVQSQIKTVSKWLLESIQKADSDD